MMDLIWGKKMEVSISSSDIETLFTKVRWLEEEIQSLKKFKKNSKTHRKKEIPSSYVTAHEFYNKYKFCSPATVNTWINQNKEFFDGYCIRSRDTYVCPYRAVTFVLSNPKKNPCLSALKDWYYYLPELRDLVNHVQLTEPNLIHRI